MGAFQFTRTPIAPGELRLTLADPACGGYAAFEGWVRDSNEGQRVRGLEYEAFEALGVREGERIMAEALARFGVAHAACVHRIGALQVGELRAQLLGRDGRAREAEGGHRACSDRANRRPPVGGIPRRRHRQAAPTSR